MKNKKGVSPLIATILLIAFAVAVGSVVMNWTSSAQGIDANGNTGVCEKIKINVEKETQKSVCFDRNYNKIRITIINDGKKIDGLRLNYVAKKADIIDIYQMINQNEKKDLEINYDIINNGEISSIKINPFLVINGKNIYCTNSGDFAEKIRDC